MKSSTPNSEESLRPSRHEICMEWAVIAAKRSTCLRNKVGAMIAIDWSPALGRL